MKIKTDELLNIVQGDWNKVKIDSFTSFAIDSRKAREGSLFFAIKGKQIDGHLFLEDAYKNGAIGAVVEEKTSFIKKDFLILQTNSVQKALFNLGKYARNKLKGKVIGITGSAGKTTTKEMVSLVLDSRFPISKTAGNANTELSIPLFFLNDADLKSAFHIVEMGIQKTGDMDTLNEIVNPDSAILLNAGMSHIEYLGSVENVANEKFKLAKFVDSKRGINILNGNDAYFKILLKELKNNYISFGLSRHNAVSAKIKSINADSMELEIWTNKGSYPARFPFSGVNFVYDLLAAIAIGFTNNISLKKSINALLKFTPVNGRGSEIKLSEDRILIDETYNSNPISLEYSLSRFKNHRNRLFILLGDMLELGEQSENAHRKIGKIIASFNPSFVLAVGKYSKFTIETLYENGVKNVFYLPKKGDLLDFLKDKLDIPPSSAIFVKGSRGMHMEDAVKVIKERFKR